MKALAIDSELAEARVYLGDVRYIYEWDWSGAEDEYKRALALNIAEDYMYLGEKEQALHWLEKAVDDRDDYVTFLNVEPVLDPLRDDPRFKGLLRRVGAPQ